MSEWLTSPVVRYELARRFRRWDGAIWHAIYVATCCALVALLWPTRQTDPVAAAARTQQLRYHLLLTQILMVAVVVPIVAAPLLAREKEARTYVLLLSSAMHPRQVFAAKFSVATVYVMLLVVGALPAYTALGLNGGTHWVALAEDVLIVAATAFLLAAAQLAISAAARQSTTSLLGGYGAALAIVPVVTLLVAWRAEWLGAEDFPNLRRLGRLSSWLLAGLTVLAVAATYARVCQRLTRPRDEDLTPAEEEDEEKQPNPLLVELRRERFPDRWLIAPRRDSPIPDATNPVFDAERRILLLSQGLSGVRLLIQVACLASLVTMAIALQIRPEWAFAFSWFLLGLVVAVGPILASGAWHKDRSGGTLDLLKCTTLTATQVLFGKGAAVMVVLVSLLLMVSVIQVLLPVLLVWIPMKLPVTRLLASVAIPYLHVATVVGVAFCCAVIARNQARALVGAYFALGLMYFGGAAALAEVPPWVGAAHPVLALKAVTVAEGPAPAHVLVTQGVVASITATTAWGVALWQMQRKWYGGLE